MSVVMNAPLAHDGARYRPAMQPVYSEAIVHADITTRTAGRLTNADLDMLSGGGLITVPHFLQSAPHGLRTRPCMVSQREPAACEGLIDSGGYQISTGKLQYSEAVHFEMLRYSEQFEAACILDAPTSAIGQNGFHSFGDCLTFTKQNGEYTIRNRVEGAAHFLNVLQGRSRREALDWLHAVSSLSDPRVYGCVALDGWAFAGATRTHFSIVLEMLVRIRDARLLRGDARVHFLGLGHPEIACVLTAIQDSLRDTVGECILVSFDNATPLLLAGKYQQAFGTPSLTRQQLYVPAFDMPCGPEYVGSDRPWPCSSPFADRLSLGDLNVRKQAGRKSWDSISFLLLAAHNVWVLSASIAEANRRLRLKHIDARTWLPNNVVEMARIAREILRSEQPMTLIRQHQKLLDSLSHKSRNTRLIDDQDGFDR